MHQQVLISDYQLFKTKNYDLLFIKYEPLLKDLSEKHYRLLQSDKSLEYEDIYRENQIRMWNAIKDTEKKMIKRKFNDGMRFGIILKLWLQSYNRARVRKKKTKINREAIRFSNESPKTILEDISYIVESTLKDNRNKNIFEEKFLYEKFMDSLGVREKCFCEKLERGWSLHQLSNYFNQSENKCANKRRILRRKCIDFLKKEGYRI